MKKTIMIAVGVIVLVGFGLLVAGIAMVVDERYNQTEIVVLGPGEAITFRVDGGEPITVQGNARKMVRVEPGKHTVTVEKPKKITHTLKLAEFERWIVPAIQKQCYGKLDVSLSHYGERGGKPIAPQLRDVSKRSKPFKLGKDHYLHPNDLPGSNADGNAVWLFRSATCATLEKMQKRTP